MSLFVHSPHLDIFSCFDKRIHFPEGQVFLILLFSLPLFFLFFPSSQLRGNIIHPVRWVTRMSGSLGGGHHIGGTCQRCTSHVQPAQVSSCEHSFTGTFSLEWPGCIHRLRTKRRCPNVSKVERRTPWQAPCVTAVWLPQPFLDACGIHRRTFPSVQRHDNASHSFS